MRILDPGHKFIVAELDDIGEIRNLNNIIQYVKREGSKYPGNVGHYPGTTIQEVCRVQIARFHYLSIQSLIEGDYESYNENQACIYNERDTINRLEKRAARRHKRVLKLTYEERSVIDELPTCTKCGHIKPETHTECHAS